MAFGIPLVGGAGGRVLSICCDCEGPWRAGACCSGGGSSVARVSTYRSSAVGNTSGE